VWPIFATLARTLRGDRTAANSPSLSGNPEGVEAFVREWSDLLLKLKLSPDALQCVFESGALDPHFRYHRFFRRKRDGGRREISEPDARLKALQHAILRRYLAAEPSHPAAVAYQVGKSTADHIWTHAGAAVIVLADVQDFFPNTRAERIEDWWHGRVDADTARLLALLTTDRGGLPQGAPTSPALSNVVNRDLDTRLAQRAAVAGARYSRYCDDIAFSWPLHFGVPGGFEPGVRAVLHEYGYNLHPTKGWRVYDRRDEPEITGAILTRGGRVRLPERVRAVMRDLARSTDPRDTQRLSGYEGYEQVLTRPPHRRKKKLKARRPAPPKAYPLPPPPPARPSAADDHIPF
jgi:hypothetical protein